MGSICSAIIVCKVFNLPDPREEGSKNPGATNVLRLAGKQYAALVLLVDLLKGTIPVVIAQACGASPAVVSLTVLAAVLGHMYPVFFGMHGGKGVATAIGALLGLNLIVGTMVIATWLLVVNFSRYSSLASMISLTLSPLYTLLVTHELTLFPPLFFMVLLIIYKHKNNITRLMDGSEPKVFIKDNVIKEIMDDESSPAMVVTKSTQPRRRTTAVTAKKVRAKKSTTLPEEPVKTKRAPRAKTDDSLKNKKKPSPAAKPKKPKAKPKNTQEGQ